MSRQIELSIIGAVIVATASSIIYLFTNFVQAEEFHKEISEINLSIAYGQFYDRLDDYEEAIDEGREELAREYGRQMEKLRAEICEHDPEWERCEDGR